MKIPFAFLVTLIAFYSCSSNSTDSNSNVGSANQTISTAPVGAADAKRKEPLTQTSGPKTVRDFFMLLPEKYFVLEGCDRTKDTDCKKAREEYLKTFAEVDIANGYIKGDCDGAQACIEMAIFKRLDNTYLVGVATFAEMMNDYYFLDYGGGKWKDVSSSVVPKFSKKNMYELPRNGTTVQVFAKKIIEQGRDFEASEKGKKLYDLEWKDGKFTIKR